MYSNEKIQVCCSRILNKNPEIFSTFFRNHFQFSLYLLCGATWQQVTKCCHSVTQRVLSCNFCVVFVAFCHRLSSGATNKDCHYCKYIHDYKLVIFERIFLRYKVSSIVDRYRNFQPVYQFSIIFRQINRNVYTSIPRRHIT